MRPVVLLGCDGVLADFITPCLRVIADLTGVQHAHDDVDVWDFDRKFLPLAHERAVYWERITAKGFCASLQPYEGAQRGVERLSGVADVYVVTSPMLAPHWAHERQQWLREHFGIEHKRIVSTHAKRLVHGDVFVDDKPEHIDGWRDANGGATVLWARAYNQGKCLGQFRANDWSLVERLARAAERSST